MSNSESESDELVEVLEEDDAEEALDTCTLSTISTGGAMVETPLIACTGWDKDCSPSVKGELEPATAWSTTVVAEDMMNGLMGRVERMMHTESCIRPGDMLELMEIECPESTGMALSLCNM